MVDPLGSNMASYEGYNIVNAYGRFKEINTGGKGVVPMLLRGVFTTDREAIKAIDMYLATNKGKQNVKTEGNG